MRLETFNVPIVLPVFSSFDLAILCGIFLLNVFLAFIYFYTESKYQREIGFDDYLNFNFSIKIIPIALFMFILGPVMTLITLVAFVGKKIRHKKNPPEEVIARFENDI